MHQLRHLPKSACLIASLAALTDLSKYYHHTESLSKTAWVVRRPLNYQTNCCVLEVKGLKLASDYARVMYVSFSFNRVGLHPILLTLTLQLGSLHRALPVSLLSHPLLELRNQGFSRQASVQIVSTVH